jgi:hypothetical protein
MSIPTPPARFVAAAALVVGIALLAPHAAADEPHGGSEATRQGADGAALRDTGDATPREPKGGQYVVEQGSHTGGGPTGGARDIPDARAGQGMGSPPPPERPAEGGSPQ